MHNTGEDNERAVSNQLFLKCGLMKFDDGLIVHLWSEALLVVHAKHNRAVAAKFQHSPYSEGLFAGFQHLPTANLTVAS